VFLARSENNIDRYDRNKQSGVDMRSGQTENVLALLLVTLMPFAARIYLAHRIYPAMPAPKLLGGGVDNLLSTHCYL